MSFVWCSADRLEPTPLQKHLGLIKRIISVSRGSRSSHTGSPIFQRMDSPESLLSKDPLYQKIAKFAPSDKVADAEIRREAIAVP